MVELSIVIVVIGLLAGGVMTGAGLIKQARLRRVQGQVEEALRAATVFSERFGALPGDMPDASKKLSEACAGVTGCNGNGDGRIGFRDFGPETYMAWRHLAGEELLSGTFNGLAGEEAKVNFPETSLKGTGLRWRFETVAAFGNLPAGNALMLTGTKEGLDSPAVSPKDAYTLDEKFDDGLPDKGKVLGYYGEALTDGTKCFSGATASGDAAYLSGQEQPGCLMLFRHEW